MRIRRIHIDGYGVYADFTSLDLHQNVVVFKGANEAGKSTLLWFIRQVLFGYPDRRQREPAYPPLRGGRFGGWLELVDSNGNEYRVERREGARGGALSIQLGDGEAGTAADLDRLLAGVQSEVFRSVFAFSLHELSQLQSSFGDDLQSRIYGAGMTGRGPHILDVEERLEREKRELLSARSGRIRDLLNQHSRLKQELADLSNDVTSYDNLVQREEQLRHWLEERGPKLEVMRRQLAYLEGAEKAWESWVLLRTAESRLEALPVIEEFPDDGVNRFQQLEEGLQQFDNRKNDLIDRIDTAQRDIDETVVDEDLLNQAPRVQALYRRLAHYLSAEKDLPVLKTQLKEASSSVQQTLVNLGADWTEERLHLFDVSLPAHETVRRYRQAALEAEQNLQTTHQTVAQRREAMEHEEQAVQLRRQRLEQLPSSEAGDPGEAQARVTAARQLLQAARSVDASRKELAHQKARHDDLSRQLSQSQLTSRLTSVVPKAVGLFVGVALTGVGLAVAGERVGGTVLGIIGVLLVLTLLYLRKSSLFTQPRDLSADYLRERINALESETQAVEKTLQDAEQVVAEQAGFLGISPVSDPYAAEELLNHVIQDEQKLQRREEAKAQVREAEASLQAAEERLRDAEEELKQARARWEESHKTWSDWLVSQGLAGDLSPDFVLDMFRLVQVARERINTRDSLSERVERVEKEVEDFRTEVASLLKTCHRPESVPDDAAAAVQRLQSELETARESQQKVAGLRDRVQEYKQELVEVKRRWDNSREEMRALLKAAGARDGEEFRQKATDFESRQRLRAEIDKHDGALKMISGPGEAYDSLRSFLTKTDPSKLEAEIAQMQEQLNELEQQERQVREEIGQVRAQITSLEARRDTSAKLLEQRQTQERLSVAVRNWAAASIAHHILSQAREDYERQHQPLVIKAAERFFSTITHGRYPRLFVSTGSHEIQAEAASGERKTVAELSRGTAEQLYLAMRLGLVSHMGKRGEPLPVIMDDVLVNFDPERAEQTCLALAELSEVSQVLYFTCHPETAGYLEQAAQGNCQVVLLSL